MPKQAPLSPLAMAAINAFGRFFGGSQTWLYRATGGRLGGKFMGAPVLLLTTVGRKSGVERTSPLLFLKDGERFLIVASKGGFPTHPAWYLNLQANPAVTVQVGPDTLSRQARTVSDEEKTRYWPELVKMYPGYQEYQERTDRSIPVVALEPR